MTRLSVAVTAVVVVAFATVGAPVASANTLLYSKGDQIWLANPDGSSARAITPVGPSFTVPSESDNGTVVAVGPGTMSDGSPVALGDIWVMDNHGNLNHRITTYEDVPCGGLTLPITFMQISPDGSKIAFYEHQCVQDATWWIPTSATGVSQAPNQTQGQGQVFSPAWIDNGHLLLDQVAEPFLPPGEEFNTYTVGNGDNSFSPWFSDVDGAIRNSGWAFGFYATIDRQGDKIAVIETDGNLTPQRVELHVFTPTGPPPAPPTLACAITLPPAASPGTYLGTPSFSPDGTKLAFQEADGIHIADLSNLSSNCANGSSPPLVVPGAIQPFWSPAGLPPIGGGGGGTGPKLSKLHLKTTTLRKGHGKLTLAYRDSAAGKATITISRAVTGVKHGSKCQAQSGKPRHGAKSCTLFVKVAFVLHRDRAGTNTVTVPAALTKKLKRGRYQLTLVAKAGGHTSRPLKVMFKVV